MALHSKLQILARKVIHKMTQLLRQLLTMTPSLHYPLLVQGTTQALNKVRKKRTGLQN